MQMILNYTLSKPVDVSRLINWEEQNPAPASWNKIPFRFDFELMILAAHKILCMDSLIIVISEITCNFDAKLFLSCKTNI